MSRSGSRTYRMTKRADLQAGTRQRIVDAAIELHRTIGPAATTMTDIAEKAGIGRVTLYRHFADEMALSRACSGHYMTVNPLPVLIAPNARGSPLKLLRAGLQAAYAYHRANEAMFGHVMADARDHPVMAPYHAHWQQQAEALAALFSRSRVDHLVAGIGLAVTFDTWQMLARRQGLSDSEAAELMSRLACPCAGAD
jgi:AcrR family transcriptional regulator